MATNLVEAKLCGGMKSSTISLEPSTENRKKKYKVFRPRLVSYRDKRINAAQKDFFAQGASDPFPNRFFLVLGWRWVPYESS